MGVKRVVTLIMLITGSMAACSSNDLAIYYYPGCDNTEVSSDIRDSVEGISEFAKENRIALGAKEEAGKCGYLLVSGKENKYVGTAMTDLDLMVLSKEFFRLEKQ